MWNRCTRHGAHQVLAETVQTWPELSVLYCTTLVAGRMPARSVERRAHPAKSGRAAAQRRGTALACLVVFIGWQAGHQCDQREARRLIAAKVASGAPGAEAPAVASTIAGALGRDAAAAASRPLLPAAPPIVPSSVSSSASCKRRASTNVSVTIVDQSTCQHDGAAWAPRAKAAHKFERSAVFASGWWLDSRPEHAQTFPVQILQTHHPN